MTFHGGRYWWCLRGSPWISGVATTGIVVIGCRRRRLPPTFQRDGGFVALQQGRWWFLRGSTWIDSIATAAAAGIVAIASAQWDAIFRIGIVVS